MSRPTLVALLALLLLACGEAPSPGAPRGAGELPPAPVVALNNRGVGEMGHFDYAAARDTFAAVVERAPGWLDGRVNLAIATLNRRQPGDEASALALVEGVLAADPEHLRAHYVYGILRFNQGAVEAARARFRRVFEADPGDAYAAYFYGQSELQLGAPEAALAALERALELDPYLRSAWYGAFLAEQRLGRREAARERLETYQRLERNPRSRLAEIAYTKMGARAEARAFRTTGAEAARAAGVDRWEATGEPAVVPGLAGVGVLAAVPHVDGATAELALPGAEGLTVLDGDGEALALPFAGDPAVTTVGWGDFDDDGRTDVYLGRDGPDALWLRKDTGWEDVAQRAGTALPGRTSDVLVLDADHDGDLDVFVTRDGAPDELLNNDGDGTFRPLAAERGMADAGRGGRVSAIDLDGDRDLDLLVARPGRGLTVFLNDRLWAYRQAAGPAGLTGQVFVAADFGADGEVEVCGPADDVVRCWAWVDGSWAARSRIRPAHAAAELALADPDGDGAWELVIAGAERWSIAEPDGAVTATGAGAVLAVWNRAPTTGPKLVLRTADGRLEQRAPVGGAFTALSFAGRDAPGESMRSNASGIGTRFVLRNGEQWTVGWRLPAASGPGSSLQPAVIGQPARPAEYVEIDWSDGVFQTELALAPRERHHIRETQRQLASCPVLFAWDGERYRFLSDVLGVAGIGFAVGPGEYSRPRPREAFRIPAEALAPLDGALELRLTEPMEEIAYVDRVRLEAIDRPAALAYVLDERMATADPQPTGEPLYFTARYAPVAARDRAGRDVLAAVREQDRVAAPPGPRDPRFLGLLAQEQQLTLEFAVPLDSLSAPVLLLDGWVEYGYSQTSFAAWQAGRGYEPPTLEVMDAAGGWVPVAVRFGYPAGMPREAALPLPALPPGARRLRLRTNQEVYFDRLAVVEAIATDTPVRRALPLASARVERIGFPRRTDGPQRQPGYDYADRTPFWDTRYQRGFYTRLGDAGELVAARDNALAIIGPGDALVLRFESALPPLPAGWHRDYVVRFDGWAKDMDLYTATGETVAPLPRATVPVDRAAVLHARYNTRFQSGR